MSAYYYKAHKLQDQTDNVGAQVQKHNSENFAKKELVVIKSEAKLPVWV